MTHTSNSSPATAGATKLLSFPVRSNAGAWDKLRELGARLTADGEEKFAIGAFQVAECEVPAGWEIRDTDVSPWQKRLYDADGKMLAKIFIKPTGGVGSIHVFINDDDPMAGDDVIPAFTHKVEKPVAVTSNGELVIGGLRGINDGGRSRLIEMGARITSSGSLPYYDVQVPAGWQLRESGVSPWQKRLFDPSGNLIAQVFIRPTGGTPSMHVFLSDDEAKAVSG